MYIYVGFYYDYYDFLFSSVSQFSEKVIYSQHPLLRNNTFERNCYRLLAKFHNHFSEKPIYKSLFDGNATKAIYTSDANKICFVIWSGIVETLGVEYLLWLKRHYCNSRIICLLTDTIEHYIKINSSFDIEQIKKNCDLVVSYNEIDCQNYLLILNRPMIVPFKSSSMSDNDVFFVGSDKGRFENIIMVFDICTDHGLSCDFYVSGVDPSKRVNRKGMHYINYMPYKEAIYKASRSKCILNLIQDGANGITLRDYEAIGMNKKLITNNQAMFMSDFYTKSKVINVKKIEEEIYKVQEDDSIPWNGISTYSINKYYGWLDELICTMSSE